MRFLLLFFVLYVNVCFTQTTKVADLIKLKPTKIQKLPFYLDSNLAYIQMPFAQSNIIKIVNEFKLNNLNQIHTIALLYTRFKELDTFNQPELNLFRFNMLKNKYPALFKLPNIKWKIIEQAKANTKEDAQNYFHGFALFFKNPLVQTYTKKSIESISFSINSYKDSIVVTEPTKKIKIKRRRTKTGIFLPKSPKKRKAGKTYLSAGIWGRDEIITVEKDTLILSQNPGGSFNIGTFNSLKGNKDLYYSLRQFGGNMAIVVDVTASMSANTAQVMVWLKNNPTVIKNSPIIFFNDGDDLPEPFKQIGNIGGIYTSNSRNLDSVFITMSTAMLNGLGGAIPENYVESILHTQTVFPQVDSILVVADALSKPNDMILSNKITKPINIIVAGEAAQIAIEFLQIAGKSGGYIVYNQQPMDPRQILKSNFTAYNGFVISKTGSIKKI